jgi:transposase
MRKIKEIIRLKFGVGLSLRAIQQSLNVSYGTVSNYIRRAEQAGLGWPLPPDIDERTLARLLFPSAGSQGHQGFAELDYLSIYQELKSPLVTKFLLWQEYRERHPEDGYSYAQYCHRYLAWQQVQKPSMRQQHKAGEKLFIDYCGPTMDIVNPDTGEVRTAQLFVATWGASNYTYAEATWSQNQADFINAHVRVFEFFKGTPKIVVPDNLKSGVIKTHRYEPDINPAYQQMAEHYQVAIIPARPYRPKDKSKVEGAVLVVERWIMARLRHQTFFTLASLNQAIDLLLADLNDRPFKKLPGSRRSQFEQLDQPLLQPLPKHRYEYQHIKKARVHIDYHIDYEHHYYSVPYTLLKQEVEVHANAQSVVIYHQGARVAIHARSYRKGGHSTLPEHRPKVHQAMTEWSPKRFLGWAASIGSETRAVVEHILQEKRHPEQSYRRILALLSNAKKFSPERLNRACGRALLINSPTRTSVESILKQGLDQSDLADAKMAQQTELGLDDHENIRGESYYH